MFHIQVVRAILTSIIFTSQTSIYLGHRLQSLSIGFELDALPW